jgi:hypothetical protein
MLRTLSAFAGAFTLAISSIALAGPYSGPSQITGTAPDLAIPSNSPLLTEWANQILPVGSGTFFAPRGSTAVSQTSFNSLGDLDAAEIASGTSPGFITVRFPTGIRNTAGPDFAVFENGFEFGSPNGLFMELAYVEVSTNGTDFARFPAISTNTQPVQGSGAFAGYDTSNVYNLAGKHAANFGTPFNLDDLTTHPLVASNLVDLANIQFVRLVDIPGNGSFLDSQNNPIYDNWLTTGTGGFDFRLPPGQGIGVINAIPEPSSLLLAVVGGFSILARRRPLRFI